MNVNVCALGQNRSRSVAIIFRFAQILVHSPDPDSTTSTCFTRLVYRLRLSILATYTKTKVVESSYFRLLCFMCPWPESN